jgi:hypothetical protein
MWVTGFENITLEHEKKQINFLRTELLTLYCALKRELDNNTLEKSEKEHIRNLLIKISE